ncbi:DHA2 family efflux MFS transporter permease subunit [Nocardia panacis]|uniref:DHA2 family efflux MFS transporter permease subunit n=1 Tax=Nocardia panacis TaxID=2340916 RepID=A0A3A4JU62_9NOCA|nr:MFS transporter [Nocardia panacis]RJO73586.1 DHA2 family efflux MFS transporter permease subunit [Nocardia panacis]
MTTTVADPSARRKWLVLATCCLSLFIVSMDASIVNVAIPAIRTDLNASMTRLQWIIDIYTLTLATFYLLSGATADRFGRKRMFRIGLIVFGIGSLLCSLAPNIEVLIAARLVQGLGGSMLNPVAMSIITTVFPGRMERARAVGIWGAVVGIAMALGPIVGGVLIDAWGWQSVFWINLPICAVAVVLTTILVPESKSSRVRRFDPVGQLLAMIFLFTLMFGLIEAQPAIFLAAVLAVGAFIWYERRHAEPFIDLRFFHSAPFSSATVIAVFAFAGLGAFLFTNSIYLQSVRGYSAVHTGILYLAMAMATLVSSPLSGRLVGRYGTRPSLLIAGIAMTAAALALTQLDPHTPVWVLLSIFAVFGLGFGAVNAPITTSAVSGMPLDRAGAAAAVASTSRQVGVSVGVALCGLLSTTGVWWVIAVFTAGVALLGLLSNTAWARRSQERVAPMLEQKVLADVR